MQAQSYDNLIESISGMPYSIHEAATHPQSSREALKFHVRWIDVNSGKTLRETRVVVDRFNRLWGDAVFKINEMELPPGAYSVIVAATEDDPRFDDACETGLTCNAAS